MNREIFGSLDHCTFYMFYRSMGQYSDIACVASNNVGDMMFPCLYRIVEPSKSLCRTRPTEPWRFHCLSIYLCEFCISLSFVTNRILVGPPEIPLNCSTRTLSQTSVRIECTPGFNGGSPQHFLLQSTDSSQGNSQFHTISNNSSPMFTVDGLTADSNYTLRMCSASSAFARTISCGAPVQATTSPAGAC